MNLQPTGKRVAMRIYVLSVLAYVAATFVTQAASHFAVNADHYAAVTYLRKDPIFPLGVLSMLIQGCVLSYLYARTAGSKRSIPGAIGFAWMGGSILVTYIALAEAAKYQVPSVTSWLWVEGIAGFIQFTLYGTLLGLVHRSSVEVNQSSTVA
jgi:hypothetical protein